MKDQTVTMLLTSKWDCSDHQGSGPFPGVLEPHKFPGSMRNLEGDGLSNDQNWTNPAKPGGYSHFDLEKKYVTQVLKRD